MTGLTSTLAVLAHVDGGRHGAALQGLNRQGRLPDRVATHAWNIGRHYAANLLRHGFTEEDLAGGGSDRLIDAIVPHGRAEQVAETVHAHLDAGANHVCLQPVGHGGVPLEDHRALGRVLIPSS